MKIGMVSVIVNNPLAAFRRLKERGIVFKKLPTENEWGIEAVFDDTYGNFIQLHQAKS